MCFPVKPDALLARDLRNCSTGSHATFQDTLVVRPRGRISFSRQTLIAAATSAHSRAFVGDVAGAELEPGKERPILSMAAAMVLAVYIPPQAPGPGQTWRSMSPKIWFGLKLPFCDYSHNFPYLLAPKALKHSGTLIAFPTASNVQAESYIHIP